MFELELSNCEKLSEAMINKAKEKGKSFTEKFEDT